ncbi:MAG: hypothetical protein WC974_09850 [Thermoplasmata archaeon]
MNKDITFHYTNPEMARDLICLIPISETDTILDAGSGKNKVWYNSIQNKEKYECEIEDGCDFFEWTKKVDWVIGNPPFHLGKDFLLKASDIAQKGIAFLINNQCFNSFLLPSRLEILKNKGFYIQSIKVVQDKRWFGRYYFLIFTKEKNDFISWNTKTYE